MEPQYDFIIIGGGSAGYAAAKEAQKLGLRTALIEGGKRLGGLCLLHGCMPSKVMLESANRFHEMGQAEQFGLSAGGEPRFDAAKVIARKRKLVDEFAGERADELKDGGFELLRGLAKFVDAHTVEFTPLEDKASNGASGKAQRLTAGAFLIATGSKIKEAPIPGLEETGCLTSDTMQECEEAFRSVIVLGAGPVGLEAAHYYRCQGAEVTVLNAAEQILSNTDSDVSVALEHAMEKRGMKFFCDAEITGVSRDKDGGKRVQFKYEGKERSVAAQELVYAIGREPCTEDLDLPAAGVKTDKKKHAEADHTQRSSAKNIFAAGDVCGPYEVLHIAVKQGEIAARNAARTLGKLSGKVEECNHRLRLLAVYTEPEVATLGMSEEEATEAKEDFHAASYPFKEHGRAIVEGATEGIVKLIAKRGSGEILGAAAVGPRAAELIHEMVAVMFYKGTAKDIAEMPHYHPTLSEIWTYPAEELANEK